MHATLQWFLGDPASATAAEHFALLPGALATALGEQVNAISAASGEGVPDIARRIFALCPPRPIVAPAEPAERRIAFSGTARDWTVTKEAAGYRVTGGRAERLATGIDWESPDAAAYFQRLLQKTGIEGELRALGAKDGDTVRIGEKELEWHERGAGA